MSSPSNLYAEKIYSEHPLALWALDDYVDYLSLITEQQREISEPTWSIDGVDEYYESVLSSQPFLTSIVNTIEGTPNGTIELISPNLTQLKYLQESLGTLCIGTYYYSNSDNYNWIELGYQYVDSQTGLIVENVKRFTSIVQDKWAFISNTFEIPDDDNYFRIVIRIDLNAGGITSSDYLFHINGLSVGQWSEEFNTTSLGSNSINLPSNIGLNTTNLKCIESSSYGINNNTGYYIIDNDVLTAKNTSIPLVYGSSGVIRLLPNFKEKIDSIIDGGTAVQQTTDIVDGGIVESELSSFIDGGFMRELPSYIIPGQGFLNNSGKYKTYTLEFWTRIDSNSTSSRRIVGPVGSDDGIYVEGGHITLAINNKFKSHFVGEWIRPMLIHLIYDKTSASLLINGEEVINISLNLQDLVFPSILNNDDKNQDYIGFYTYPEIPSFEIDSIAIYSYKVSNIVAKRRFVYGQGTGSSELINNSYSGTEAFIDYSFSEYTADYNYPDFAGWNQGFFDNVVTDGFSLNTPEYQLPTVYFNNKTIDNLYNDCLNIQDKPNNFITFRPNSSWDNTIGFLNFPRLDVLQTTVKMIYTVFSVNNQYENDQIILKIYNNENTNYLKVVREDELIKYIFNYNDVLTELYSFGYTSGQPVVVGIKIDDLAQNVDGIYSFFNNQSTLKMYFGGDETGLYTFGGELYTIGFGSDQNSIGFNNFIDGIANPNEHMYFLNKLASYTLLPTKKYKTLFFDIGISGYWEDYAPLSYFAKYVNNQYGNQYYDFDFIQFNLDYPIPSVPILDETTSEWTYEELEHEFDSPVQKTYYQLDNENYTGWQNYEDLNQKADKYKKYDTSNQNVKAYISMQYILDGANLLPINFTNIGEINENRVLDFSKHNNWQTHKFEAIDGCIIYPPKNININNLAIVYRLEFNIRNTVNKPTKIKSLQLASLALDHNKFNEIGTKYGSSLYLYSKSGFYYDYNSKNPIALYKKSTPYLYMTKDSGIEIRNEYEDNFEKGLSFTINNGGSPNFKVSAMQFWMRSNKYEFPAEPQKLFDVVYLEDTIEFFIQSNSYIGNRGKIFAISKKTQQPFTSLVYYINGKFVREPVISIKEWSVIGLSFDNNLIFDNFLGSINLTSPYTFNNIAFYQATNLQLAQSQILQSWSKIRVADTGLHDWEDWLSYTWNQVLVIGQSDLYGTNPADVYKAYIGTNKIIIDDNSGLLLNSDKLKVYKDSSWQSYITVPV